MPPPEHCSRARRSRLRHHDQVSSHARSCGHALAVCRGAHLSRRSGASLPTAALLDFDMAHACPAGLSYEDAAYKLIYILNRAPIPASCRLHVTEYVPRAAPSFSILTVRLARLLIKT